MGPSVSFLGHASTLIEIDGVRVLTDPLLRSRITFLRRVVAPAPAEMSQNIDVVLISHLHHDHCDLASLAMLSEAVVVAPQGAGGYLRTRGKLPNVIELNEGESAQVCGLVITAVHADHDGLRPPLGPRAIALGYVVSGDDGTVYFAGDTDVFPEMANLPMPDSRGLDVALLPVWGWGPNLGPGHMNPQRAADALKLLEAKIAVPIHWGTLFPAILESTMPGARALLSQPPRQFAELAAAGGSGTEVVVTEPGKRVRTANE
ncbi:MAG: MBL fold metallo-hydrolase [Candidatus Nanopelagicales bacterium]